MEVKKWNQQAINFTGFSRYDDDKSDSLPFLLYNVSLPFT